MPVNFIAIGEREGGQKEASAGAAGWCGYDE
eukprot:CAMPEP_0197733742 /NCGR_PEP_ID=MMETSP1434-20131217/44063_1 /TAXON_ID=265543 /ORGANISM="Minutocellus polymorphus, Strain CCMP3303" /LENGTH=30 /DNA_ID= /DNA_START= /DNA_END= /DNA_ORIENTATION=